MATLTYAATVPTARPTGPGVRRFAWGVLGYNILIILWGAVVRSTGSGNGCGDHWPLCNGTLVQHWQTLANVIEFAHRASVGVGVVLLLALAVWTWRGTSRRHFARVFAGISLFLTFNEGLLGALLVVLHHTGTDQSPMRAFWLSLHLANTLLLLAALALTAHFIGRQEARMRGTVQLFRPGFTLAGLFATLCVGVSGSLAALGDTLYPARSLAEAFAQDFSPHASWLLRVRWMHPTLSVVAAVWVGFLLLRSWRESPRLARAAAGLLALQFVLGAADVLLLAPTWLQVLHLLGADLLWTVLVTLAARVTLRPLGCFGPVCALQRAQDRSRKPQAVPA